VTRAPSSRTPSRACAALALLSLGALEACPAPRDNQPCFPTTASEDVPWLSHRDLGWEIDEMAVLPSAPKTTDPPSESFARAERDLRTEFYIDAAKGLLAVVHGDTHDGRGIRQTAQFHLAIALYRLHYYAEARRIFRLCATTPGHPMKEEASEWVNRRVCGG
jgi:hypothetical protein